MDSYENLEVKPCRLDMASFAFFYSFSVLFSFLDIFYRVCMYVPYIRTMIHVFRSVLSYIYIFTFFLLLL